MENGYLIVRYSLILQREAVFEFLKLKEVSKIELPRGKNSTLNNADVCKAYIYRSFGKTNANSLIGNCLALAQDHPNLSKQDRQLLRNMNSCKQAQFFRRPVLKKLLEFIDRTGINPGMGKELMEFVREFK